MVTRSKEINNSDDIIDSRNVIARIEELEDMGPWNEDEATGRDEDEEKELTALKALADEASGSPDWTYGETLIRDDYFKEYAEQVADDIGAIDRNATWPTNCIDWDLAAEQLQQDYFTVDFDGVTYWIRS